MNENLIKAQDIVLEKINHICREFGLNNIMAQLYAILYFSSKPLSLDDMLERLKISKGSVSVNIRALERYGAVRRLWIKGSRRDYYEAETDISRVVLDRVRSMIQKRFVDVDDIINSSSQLLNSTTPSNKEEKESIKIFNQRLNELKFLYTRIQSLFNLFNSKIFGSIIGKSKKNNRKEPLVSIDSDRV